jgi:hypothetical protein
MLRGIFIALPVLLIGANTAQAEQGVPGCRNTCLTKCHGNGIVPYVFPSISACMAYWGPRNLAVAAAIRDARKKAGQR